MYSLVVHPDIEEQQSKLKEILYDCAVDIRATKAALFLLEASDNRFELVTEYGFRGTIRSIADEKDPVVDRCSKVRTPFFVNGLMAEPRFSEILYDSATDRMLVSPLYLRGQLIGFVDMRDKAAKQPFEQTDLPKAQRVADRVMELFTNKNVWGQRFIQLSSTGEQHPVLSGSYRPVAVANGPVARPVTGPQPVLRPVTGPNPVVSPASTAPAAAAVAAPVVAPSAPGSRVPRVSSLILEARSAVEGRLAAAADTLTETELLVVRDILRLILLIPGAVVSSFAAAGHLGGVQEISAQASMGDAALDAMQSRLDTWLKKRGEAATFARRTVHTPTGPGERPLGAADMQKVFTAPVNAASLRGLYLTVAFNGDPDRATHDLLAAMHRQLQSAIEQSVSRRNAVEDRMRIAEALLEPDFTKFPELRHHTDAVVARVNAFAKYLSLSPPEIENARLVAMVHDVGMRLLDYDTLYRKHDLSHDEMSILREHTIVGAALVEPFLGPDVARAVLSHHERYDGGGYPNDLRGAAIPLLSRVLQLCDVYEAMVAADNYQPPQTHDQAMTVIMRGAGSQFDGELAGRFVEMMRSAR